ncbi:methylmalonyl-CoA epimerase [Aquimarina sp. ERC-38]|uniref:methylmalonyl-CoA epimerase n=1 Tax=Aquimarina sp. ERC-38 TaxID=2949996 RepID=UPI002246E5A5|nr:methylmalonyl-CoA epimerase [Aquimarina sp. ERC-38]UZO81312.1 methylmalonyl-CoA epimerase [Aquimarina sp. ERC-38]
MINKIEHLGIAVHNIEEANQMYEKLLGVASYKQELVEEQGVLTSFFKVGKSKIELLASTEDDSPISKFIAKRGEGIHHIAFEVEDIKKELKRLQSEGFQLIDKVPKKGADNKLIAFVHPKSTNGTLIELCQEISGNIAKST